MAASANKAMPKETRKRRADRNTTSKLEAMENLAWSEESNPFRLPKSSAQKETLQSVRRRRAVPMAPVGPHQALPETENTPLEIENTPLVPHRALYCAEPLIRRIRGWNKWWSEYAD